MLRREKNDRQTFTTRYSSENERRAQQRLARGEMEGGQSMKARVSGIASAVLICLLLLAVVSPSGAWTSTAPAASASPSWATLDPLPQDTGGPDTFGHPGGDPIPPEPTPSPAVDIRTKIRSYQTPDVQPSLPDGWLHKEASLPPEVKEIPAEAEDQETFYTIADATVVQGYPSMPGGDTIDMWVGYDHCIGGQIARSLVQFDVSSIPAGTSISDATLRLLLDNSCDAGERTHVVTAYRTSASWSESSVTWNTKPGYAEGYGSASIPSRTWGWYSFDVTDLVRGWVDGSFSNCGLMMRGPESSGDDSARLGFLTRESNYAPELVVEYSSDTPPTTTVTVTPNETSTPTVTQPSAETSTPTATSTPTGTLTPPVFKIYLPLIRKSPPRPTPTPTPVPTATSTPVVVIENYSGHTSQGSDWRVFLRTDAQTEVRYFTIEHAPSCANPPSGLYWQKSYFYGPYYFTGGSFTIEDDGATITGSFPSSTTAEGTFYKSWHHDEYGQCTTNVTWTASKR